jgi:hypothetical protein
MSLEVYLLSIPLARHRTIVPTHRGARIFVQDAAMHLPEHRIRGLTEGMVESPSAPGERQRLDCD